MRQSVAVIVQFFRSAALRKGIRRRLIIAQFVLRRAFPCVIRKHIGGFGLLPLRHTNGGFIILALPKIRPSRKSIRGQKTQHQNAQPPAAKTERHKRQNQRGNIHAQILPRIGFDFTVGQIGSTVRFRRRQGVNVGFVQRNRAVHAPARMRDAAQFLFRQSRQNRLSVDGREIAVRQLNRRAVLRADTQNRNRVSFFFQSLRRLDGFGIAERPQNNRPSVDGFGLAQQIPRFVQRGGKVRHRPAHQSRLHGRQYVFNHLHIGRQRNGDKRRLSIQNQRALAARIAFQQIIQLEHRAFHSRRL